MNKYWLGMIEVVLLCFALASSVWFEYLLFSMMVNPLHIITLYEPLIIVLVLENLMCLGGCLSIVVVLYKKLVKEND